MVTFLNFITSNFTVLNSHVGAIVSFSFCKAQSVCNFKTRTKVYFVLIIIILKIKTFDRYTIISIFTVHCDFCESPECVLVMSIVKRPKGKIWNIRNLKNVVDRVESFYYRIWYLILTNYMYYNKELRWSSWQKRRHPY